MSVLDKIASISDKAPPLKACLYGPPGSGKTVLSAQAPNPLVLDVESGARSLLNHEWSKDTKVVPISAFKEIEDLIWAKRNGDPKLEPYETWVIDTLTELQAVLLSDLVRAKHERDTSRNAYAAQQLDYKENTEMLRRMVVALRDLPINIILIAHAVADKDESTGRISVRPALTPKLAQTVKGLMDVQGFLLADTDAEGNFAQTLQVHPANNIEVKCRVGGLPPIIENPRFDMLIKANAESAKEEINV